MGASVTFCPPSIYVATLCVAVISSFYLVLFSCVCFYMFYTQCGTNMAQNIKRITSLGGCFWVVICAISIT